MPQHSFTVEEANALIPLLDHILDDIEKRKRAVRKHYRKFQVLETLWGEEVREDSNPDHNEYVRHRKAVEAAVHSIEQTIEDEILGRGLRFPSGGLEHGLVDFPTTYEGRWILLCWQRGESRVRYWHEVDGGFNGRQEISEVQEALIGMQDDPARSQEPPAGL